MDILQSSHKDTSVVDVMRLDILMQYYARLSCGIAALQWSDPLAGGPVIQAHLVALLYGRILRIVKESRAELFARVNELARKNIRSRGRTGFEFTSWIQQATPGDRGYTLWPWQIVSPEKITSPKTCTVILKFSEPSPQAPSGRWIDLELATGQEHLFAPASALIAITGFAEAADKEGRYLLARLLWQMNRYWGSPNMVSFFSEALAYAAADETVRSGPFRIP